MQQKMEDKNDLKVEDKKDKDAEGSHMDGNSLKDLDGQIGGWFGFGPWMASIRPPKL